MTTPNASQGRFGRALRVVWNLRALGIFLIGPVVGVFLVGMIFGMPRDLRWAAAAGFLLSLCLFGMLAKGEWRRLS